jgi:hypothetical protein
LEACEDKIHRYERRLKGEHQGTAMIQQAGVLEELNTAAPGLSCQSCTSSQLAWIRRNIRGPLTKGRTLTSTFAALTSLVANVLSHPHTARRQARIMKGASISGFHGMSELALEKSALSSRLVTRTDARQAFEITGSGLLIQRIQTACMYL